MISPSRSESLMLWIRGVALVCLVAMLPTESSGLIVKTTNASEAAAFQTGATIEGFEDLSALSLSALAITSYDGGQTVPAASQFSSRNVVTFTSPFFNSGGASFNDPIGNPGTKIGIFDPNDTIAGDVISPTNVAGPLGTGSTEAFPAGAFMEVIFPVDVIRVGFWLTHGTDITMFLKDSNNSNLATGDVQVTGSGGEFIGIQRDSADIRGITLGFGTFTLDDFTYSVTPIPEPSSLLLIATGLTALVGWRRLR